MPYDQIQHYVRKASFCVFPSYAEALPLSWLEAMGCAKALVTYDIGWAREIIEPGTTGILVAPGNISGLAREIDALLAMPNKTQELGLRGRQRVEACFTADQMAELSISWYKRVLERR